MRATGGSFDATRLQAFNGVSAGEFVGGFSPGASGTNHTASVELVMPVSWIESFLYALLVAFAAGNPSKSRNPRL